MWKLFSTCYLRSDPQSRIPLITNSISHVIAPRPSANSYIDASDVGDNARRMQREMKDVSDYGVIHYETQSSHAFVSGNEWPFCSENWSRKLCWLDRLHHQSRNIFTGKCFHVNGFIKQESNQNNIKKVFFWEKNSICFPSVSENLREFFLRTKNC